MRLGIHGLPKRMAIILRRTCLPAGAAESGPEGGFLIGEEDESDDSCREGFGKSTISA